MINKLTPQQLEKIRSAERYFKNTNDADSLYYVVVIIGPSLLGSFIGSNSDTVWSRIENPGNFRYSEMEKLSEVLNISIVRFEENIQRLIEYNLEALKNKRPIGRKRYQNAQVDSKSKDPKSITKTPKK